MKEFTQEELNLHCIEMKHKFLERTEIYSTTLQPNESADFSDADFEASSNLLLDKKEMDSLILKEFTKEK